MMLFKQVEADANKEGSTSYVISLHTGQTTQHHISEDSSLYTEVPIKHFPTGKWK
jgi:hypothetical protein